ncbi:MAG: hypothetical protein HZC42_12900 [Candidatus Eisenbacteria bacterium]|nr:hypothetical protein [Candidatus Eisenbacteria bacterium]
MYRLLLPLVLVAALLGGCNDSTAPRDVTAPAAPRGLYSVTGDHRVALYWLANTESDLAGYRIYEAPCASGPDCPFARIGTTTGPSFEATGLANGVTRYFAVAAVDYAGNEGALTRNDVPDTPRPAGSGLPLDNFYPSGATNFGYDFSTYLLTSTTAAPTDIFYGYYVDGLGGVHQQVFVPDYGTDIQDAGYGGSLDDVDFAPNGGWSPSGTVEAIPGHNYVVWTRDDHYAKFRVVSAGPNDMLLDWAYQVDPGNRELRARPVRPEGTGRRPIVWLPASR